MDHDLCCGKGDSSVVRLPLCRLGLNPQSTWQGSSRIDTQTLAVFVTVNIHKFLKERAKDWHRTLQSISDAQQFPA